MQRPMGARTALAWKLHMEGKGPTEIAAEMKCSRSNARTLLSLAEDHLGDIGINPRKPFDWETNGLRCPRCRLLSSSSDDHVCLSGRERRAEWSA